MKRWSLSAFLLFVLGFTSAFGAVFNVTTPAEFQTALTTAQANGENDTINVAAGTYQVAATLTYRTPNGDGGHSLTIVGAGAGTTILDGGGTVRVMEIDTDEMSPRNDDAGANLTISGLTIRNGSRPVTGTGAGCNLFTSLASITISNNIFSGNSTASAGGGIYVQSNSGAIAVLDNTFNNNTTGNQGGGIYAYSLEGASITFIHNAFSGNSTTVNGGGAGIYAMFDQAGAALFNRNTFTGNSAGYAGGGVYIWITEASATFVNNTFSGNSTTSSTNDGGAGLYLYSQFGQAVLTNNSFAGNNAVGHGGGAYIALVADIQASASIYNNIFWNNNAIGAGDDLYVSSDDDPNMVGSAVALFNNDFSGAANFTTAQSDDLSITVTDRYTQGNNIQQDPLFVGPNDLHVPPGSPVVNAGLNTAPAIPATDFDGGARILNGTVDIGADEVEAAPPPQPPLLSARKTDAFEFNGTAVRYTIVLTNTGGEATGVVFDDTPDANTTLQAGSVTTTGGTVVTGNTTGDKSIRVNIGTVAGAGGTVTITYRVAVNQGVAAGTILRNQGTVSGGNFTNVVTDDPDSPGVADVTTAPTPASPIPALDFAGMLALVLLLAAVGAWFAVRRG